MSLNIEQLENAKYRGSRTIARCPACAEQGNDNKGEHLSIDERGRFACVIYPGAAGVDHRKRIFALVGVKEDRVEFDVFRATKMIRVKKANRNTGNVIKSNILGRLGRVFSTPHTHRENDIKDNIYDLTKSILEIKRVPDELYQQAKSELGIKTLLELTAIIGYYCNIAVQLNVFEIPDQEGRTMRKVD